MELGNLIGLYFKGTKNSSDLFQQLEDVGDVYLMGGVARKLYGDKYFIGKNHTNQIRDVDIVIDSRNKYEDFQAIMKKYPHNLNKFGGYKFKFGNMKIDIWEIRNTWAYQKNIVSCEKDEMGKNLQDTVFLNYDAVVYYVNKKRFYSEKYKECLRNEQIDIVLENNPEIYLNLLRALEFKVQTRFSLSCKLMNLFYRRYDADKNLISKLYEIEQYRKNILTRYDIEREVQDIISQVQRGY